MTPQASFLVLAPIIPSREAELRSLLAAMNHAPGRVNPTNALFPFAEFPQIHVARFLIIDDPTLADVRAHGLEPKTYPLTLAFAGDVDGDELAFLDAAAAGAASGLRAIFTCCEDFHGETDLTGWMQRHRVPAAANYVNWQGRTVQRIREDAALRAAIESYLQANASILAGRSASDVHGQISRHVRDEQSAGRLQLWAEAPTPIAWAIRDFIHCLGVPLLLLAASPLLVVFGGLGLLRIRQMEKIDPELCDRCDLAYSQALASIEDHDVSNQFTAMGSLKPGLLRQAATRFVLWVIDWGARHLFTRGRLARVRTIHFARWVFLDGGERLIFFSNYDGSLESYMDDFINKVGFGLNAVFGHGIGYPRTRWMVLDGCADERKFKEFLRRHQLPTQVWYKAYSGLTAIDLERHTRIRRGIDTAPTSEEEARQWLALL